MADDDDLVAENGGTAAPEISPHRLDRVANARHDVVAGRVDYVREVSVVVAAKHENPVLKHKKNF